MSGTAWWAREELLKGKQLGDRNYKVHLDGYDQTDMITGKGPSKRHEVWYFAQTKLGAVRVDNYKYQFIEQPKGWFGPIDQTPPAEIDQSSARPI